MAPFKKIYLFLFLIIILSSALRLVWLSRIPPSLYTDEIDQGYNAYSVLQTGKDEHGTFLPVSFRSFGDWKPPLPTYLMIPFIYVLGLDEAAIRLPSAILGIGTVILTYFLVNEMLRGKIYRTRIALLAALFTAVSPWHILQSRSAMLVMDALFFFELGAYFFLKSRTKSYFLYLSVLSFALSVYSYYGMRVIVPLICLFLLLNNRDYFRSHLKQSVIALAAGILVLLPLGLSFIKQPDVVFGRAKTVSIFFDQGVKLRQWELIAQDGPAASSYLVRLFHNNIYMYLVRFLGSLFTHFDGRYLFLTGDSAQPFQIPSMGILYIIDGLFIAIGTYFLFRKKEKYSPFIYVWLLISYIPAAFTFMTPSANRTFTAVIPLAIITAYGLVSLNRIKKSLMISGAISVIYVFCIGFFLKLYFLNLPLHDAAWWNYGWKQAAEIVNKSENKYDNIIVSDINGMPYIYFLFYGKTDPEYYQKEAVRTYISDRFGFEHVDGYGKFIFSGDNFWQFVKNPLAGKTLYITPADNRQGLTGSFFTIKYPDGRDDLTFFESK